MYGRPPSSTRTDPLLPSTTLFRILAILRTMGAPRDAVLRIFMAIGLSIGIAGTIVGMAIGFSLLYFRQGVLRGVEFLTGQPLWDPSIRRSEEQPSELQSLLRSSYASSCLKTKNEANHNSTLL